MSKDGFIEWLQYNEAEAMQSFAEELIKTDANLKAKFDEYCYEEYVNAMASYADAVHDRMKEGDL